MWVVTTYTFTVKLDTAIKSGGQITVTFPTQIQTAYLQSLSIISQTCSPFICTAYNVNSQLIIVYNITSLQPSGTVLSLQVGNILNPNSTAQTGTFSIVTSDYYGYPINQNQFITGISLATPTNLSFVGIVSVGNSSNSAITNYVFLINSRVPLSNGTVLQIVVPSTMLRNFGFMSCSPSTNLASVSCSLISPNILQTYLYFVNTALTTFQIQLNNVQNYLSFRPSSSF